MKQLFAILFALCVVWSIAVYFLSPSHESELPIMYWVTDANPIRAEQVERFHQWMKENGYPEVDLRLDTSNSDVSKKIIQGVSGVGADLIDLGSNEVRFFVEMGLLMDLTDVAKKMGFDTSRTYESLEDVLTVDGRQYMFPANVAVSALIVNVDQFERLGMKPPEGNWTPEEFERFGGEYVRKANAGLPRQLYFFCGPIIDRLSLVRSYGGDMFNETLTEPGVNSPEFIKALKLLRHWVDIGITPSAADIQSMATDSGYGGANFQLFNSGNYGMINVGRHAVILLRQVGSTRLAVVSPPQGDFPNLTIGSRAVGVYSGSRHKEQAVYFLAYLASPAYNETVVVSGDALPPDPLIAQGESYDKPEKYPNEWGFHEYFSTAAAQIAIPEAISPYVQTSTVSRVEVETYEAVMASLRSAEESVMLADARLRREIELSLRAQPALRKDHELWSSHQREIDQLKAENKKIPARLIRNPFYLSYYRHTGQLEEEPEAISTPSTAESPVPQTNEAREPVGVLGVGAIQEPGTDGFLPVASLLRR